MRNGNSYKGKHLIGWLNSPESQSILIMEGHGVQANGAGEGAESFTSCMQATGGDLSYWTWLEHI